ncbi:hypothetical protein K493DRAFT_403925 [Basidiobolus meristosporus CBS 931.73]|uniref:Zinc finger CHCC-type domain-containing protein n=1 Tax=Basidiobolus meristosporus CBS 931.73 TaxID=1314790 RepID=A0A1Y1Z9B3_9FUNG|nr:hypothetical protein K493DRAFT_403925 [Basidiobolus meristosporus CBS 931.73]|eukprot:ORY06704.1 hypothetical protein K493DRAFT_403925 [Basidiobolus meristosporus CBS 931.73]
MFRARSALLRLPAIRSYSTKLPVAVNATPEALQQASNRQGTWSLSQEEKKDAFKGPRFEQTDLTTQPNPMAAIELIHEVPIKFVQQRKVACNGGGGALGHPKVYINLDDTGKPVYCEYCGLRYQQEPHHH